MNPGDLTELVTIQEATSTSDGAGGHVRTWGDVATVWASIGARTGSQSVGSKAGRETLGDDRTTATRVITLTIRNRRDLDEAMRVVWQGSAYNIRSIYDTGARDLYLKLDCEAGVPT
jgi:SPP1 family predicted phage head-tail adaptor